MACCSCLPSPPPSSSCLLSHLLYFPSKYTQGHTAGRHAHCLANTQASASGWDTNFFTVSLPTAWTRGPMNTACIEGRDRHTGILHPTCLPACHVLDRRERKRRRPGEAWGEEPALGLAQALQGSTTVTTHHHPPGPPPPAKPFLPTPSLPPQGMGHWIGRPWEEKERDRDLFLPASEMGECWHGHCQHWDRDR